MTSVLFKRVSLPHAILPGKIGKPENLNKWIVYVIIGLVAYLVLGGIGFWIIEQPYQDSQCLKNQIKLKDNIENYVNDYVRENENSNDILKSSHSPNFGKSQDPRQPWEWSSKGTDSKAANDMKDMLMDFTHGSAKILKKYYDYECQELGLGWGKNFKRKKFSKN